MLASQDHEEACLARSRYSEVLIKCPFTEMEFALPFILTRSTSCALALDTLETSAWLSQITLRGGIHGQMLRI